MKNNYFITLLVLTLLSFFGCQSSSPPPPSPDTINGLICAAPLITQDKGQFLVTEASFPNRELILLATNPTRCLQVQDPETPTTLRQAECDVYDRNQWWFRDEANNNRLVHFASNACLVYNSGNRLFSTQQNCSTPASRQELTAICGSENYSPMKSLLRTTGKSTYSLTNSNDSSISALSGEFTTATSTNDVYTMSDGNARLTFQLIGATGVRDTSFTLDAAHRCEHMEELSHTQETNGTYLALPNILCSGGTYNTLAIRLNIDQLTSNRPRNSDSLSITRIGTTNQATMSGTYRANSGPDLLNFIIENPEVTQLNFIDLPGSADDFGLAYYGRFIRSAGYTAYLPANGQAYSGGVDLFLAGVRRIAEVGGVLGVHSWAGGSFVGSQLPVDDPRHGAVQKGTAPGAAQP